MNLTIDIGNTQSKIIIFDDTIPVHRKVVKRMTVTVLRKILRTFPIDKCMISTVVKMDKAIEAPLKKLSYYRQLTKKARLPIRNKYKTPETLGPDRLANAVAGYFLFPRRNVLIIDAGTCLKFDFVNAKGEYIGGSISPGVDMRFQAMHKFTGRLPLLKPGSVTSFTGNDTFSSMQSGVLQGMREEIRGLVNLYKKRYGALRVILTGGDAFRFAEDLNLSIFAAADLVNLGLNEIIRFNTYRK